MESRLLGFILSVTKKSLMLCTVGMFEKDRMNYAVHMRGAPGVQGHFRERVDIFGT
jgi:hypothetical protein